jgi:hypothetical protein
VSSACRCFPDSANVPPPRCSATAGRGIFVMLAVSVAIDRALDDVLQFTNIPRPAVAEQRGGGTSTLSVRPPPPSRRPCPGTSCPPCRWICAIFSYTFSAARGAGDRLTPAAPPPASDDTSPAADSAAAGVLSVRPPPPSRRPCPGTSCPPCRWICAIFSYSRKNACCSGVCKVNPSSSAACF